MSDIDYNRIRNHTISFRVSEEERRQLKARIKVTGLPIGRYILESALHQKICIAVGKYQSDRLLFGKLDDAFNVILNATVLC